MPDIKALIAEARTWDTPEIRRHVSQDLLDTLIALTDALEAATAAPAVDREALAAELYTAYTAKGWHRADEIERSDWRLVAQEVIDAGILRDVRDVQAETLEQAADAEADWTASAWRSEEAETVAKLRKGLRARAQAIREARND